MVLRVSSTRLLDIDGAEGFIDAPADAPAVKSELWATTSKVPDHEENTGTRRKHRGGHKLENYKAVGCFPKMELRISLVLEFRHKTGLEFVHYSRENEFHPSSDPTAARAAAVPPAALRLWLWLLWLWLLWLLPTSQNP